MVSKPPRAASEREASRDNRTYRQALPSSRCPAPAQDSRQRIIPQHAQVSTGRAHGLCCLSVSQFYDQTRSEQHPVPVKHGIGYGQNPRVQIPEGALGFRVDFAAFKADSSAVSKPFRVAPPALSLRGREGPLFHHHLARAFDVVGQEEIE